MKIFLKSFFYVFFITTISLPNVLHAQEALTVEAGSWNSETIAEGIMWEQYHGSDYFNSRQSINVIRIDMNRTETALRFAWSDTVLVKTSRFAEKNEALAAINGSFFDVEHGGSVVFFRKDGETIEQGAVNRRGYSENGGIGISGDGSAYILARPNEGWLSVDDPTVLGSGPLLMLNEEVQTFNNDPFNQNRHPRTAVGITESGELLLITVDGRSSEANGMSIPELTELMESMGAISALNLDGGGSTTMWTQEKGVVSYPSDNGQFDNEGERGVANALLLIPLN
ncbi:MAG: phosphodiester glycosidase family protein [Balneolaceae bacterium]